MRLKLKEYNQGYKIVSLALAEDVKDKLLEQELSVIFVNEDKIILFPEKSVVSTDKDMIGKLKEFNDFDVLEIWENGLVYRKYDDQSNENYFFVTGACNSNCIMCPSPENLRKNVPPTNIDELIKFAKHIPSDTPHLTITGGEPFLVGEKIFTFIEYLKKKFEGTEFLFLTNGRVFAMDKYVQLLSESIPYNSIMAIPIHGSCEEVHDSITQVKGSFKQTKKGIKQLIKNKICIELRLVVSRLNVKDFDKIADLIIEEFSGVNYVSVIAMEMTGNARVNKDKVWISYKESFGEISSALRKMVQNGIDVKLYNFPLCAVDKTFWTLCEKSISTGKVRFAETCEECKYKMSCGGVFAGTFNLEKDELKAIV